MSKSTLSPISLSKLYWSVCIPKLLSAGEVRCFANQELEEFEMFHKCIAKDIQNIPQNSPDPMVLASLGWRDIVSQIDYAKLMFIQRILVLDSDCIYRRVFIRRLFYIMMSGIQNPLSPVVQIVRALHKYNLTEPLLSVLQNGIMTGKGEWKKVVSNAIDDKVFASWRFVLSLYPKLDLYRIVVPKIAFICWWELTKSLPFLKKACTCMVRLLTGCHVLSVSSKSEKVRQDRLCDLCDVGAIEDTYHFVMDCMKWSQIRISLLNSITRALSPGGLIHWQGLSNEIKFYIMFGMDYPLSAEDIFVIRYSACVHILNSWAPGLPSTAIRLLSTATNPCIFKLSSYDNEGFKRGLTTFRSILWAYSIYTTMNRDVI